MQMLMQIQMQKKATTLWHWTEFVRTNVFVQELHICVVNNINH